MAEMDVKTNPRRPEAQPFGEVDQRSEHFHWPMSVRSHVWRPPTDVYVSDETVVIRVEIAGMQESEFVIALDRRTLSISGTRTDIPERRAYHQMEIRLGEFVTEVELHWPVDPQGMVAEYRDGFLKVVLPKARVHRIEIGED